MLKRIITVAVIAYLLPKLIRWHYSITIDHPDEDYDFIIVGAGTTGSVVANRLTEVAGIKVLVLEAGDEDLPNPLISVPLLPSLAQGSSIDWEYRTEPQQHACHLLKDNVSRWPCGKVLGGTSSMNFMMYVRGSKHDYDNWDTLGAKGWGFDDVIGYFKKSENAVDEKLSGVDHGKDGPLKVEITTPNKMGDILLKAGEELGYQSGDYNKEQLDGFHVLQTTTYNGERHSAATAFLRPFVNQRKNQLHILSRSHVKEILFENSGKMAQAVGVVYVRDGIEHTIKVKKEVILSAGAIRSPHVLMLSGIGDKKHLQEFGIEATSDLPGVGSNLQDHVFVPMCWNADNLPSGAVYSDLSGLLALPEYLMRGTGALAAAGGVGVHGMFRTRFATSPRQDLQMFLLASKWDTGRFTSGDILKNIFGFKEEFYDDMEQHAVPRNTTVACEFTMMSNLLRPLSRGSIKLRSSDYRVHPMIDPKYLSHQSEVDVIVEGFRRMEELEGTEAFKEVGAKMELKIKRCGTPRTTEYYECLARGATMTIYHPVGTAKIGRKEDKLAVVDSRLRVYGVERLRVADASVMPEIPSANTQAACYMIGEKVSDMIKQDWDL